MSYKLGRLLTSYRFEAARDYASGSSHASGGIIGRHASIGRRGGIIGRHKSMTESSVDCSVPALNVWGYSGCDIVMMLLTAITPYLPTLMIME